MKNVPIIKQNISSLLSETKSLMSITQKILSSPEVVPEGDRWIDRLWEWADANKIEEEILYIITTEDMPAYGGEHFIFSFDHLFDSLYGNQEGVNGIREANDEHICSRDNYTFEDFDFFYNLKTGIPRNKQDCLKLKVLDISKKNLSSLPVELFQLENLEYLNLDDNQLTDLPTAIENLKSLKQLRIGHNSLQDLPEEICSLKHLEFLYISGNSDLILTQKQKDWITKLEEIAVEIHIASDNLSNSKTEFIPEIDLDDDHGGCFWKQ